VSLQGEVGLLKTRRIRLWLCAALLVPCAFGCLVAFGEAFHQGGPIGSQTSDGYDALGPVVTQPIEFPHYIHVQKMGIDCLYCHTYARRSAVSGIPRLDKCMGCHNSIPEVKDKPRIKLLFSYWEKKQAIPWKKVRALQSRAPHPALHIRSGAPDPRGVRLLPRRCGIHDHRSAGQGDFDGMVRELSREGSQDQRRQRRDQPWAERLLAMPQVGRHMPKTGEVR
jgi:hypothetical protein